MKPVNIAGKYDPCKYYTNGTWSAVMAGRENLQEEAAAFGLGSGMPHGNCMCTAGSTDIYVSETWVTQCNRTDPSFCFKDDNGLTYGNACPPQNCEYWWGPWSQCTKSCGGGGTQTRQANTLVENRHGGLACPATDSRECNPQACPTPAPTPEPTPAPTQAPPPGVVPSPSPKTPIPQPSTPTPSTCSCPECVDVAKVNGEWPKNYVPCRKVNCQSTC